MALEEAGGGGYDPTPTISISPNPATAPSETYTPPLQYLGSTSTVAILSDSTGAGAPLAVSSDPLGGQGVALDAFGALLPGNAINFSVFTSDPINPLNGSVWVRSDTSQLCVSIQGTTKRVTLV